MSGNPLLETGSGTLHSQQGDVVQAKSRQAVRLPAMLLIAFGLVVATWLVHLLPQPFHEDEAIYAAWSLQILRGDFWLSHPPIDKPPLTFYPIAASVALFGRHEWAARLPSVAWTGVLLMALWRIGEARGRQGWLAAGLALGSPLLWAMSASAFTDMAMVALAFFSLERGLRGRAGQSGVAFALALLAKPTAIFLAPLVLLNLPHESLPRWVRAGAVPLLLAWSWDASRAAPSWWALGRNAYGTFGQSVGQIGAWMFVAAVALGGMGLVSVVWWVVGRRLPYKDALQKSPLGVVDRASPCGDAVDASLRGNVIWRWTLFGSLALWIPVHVGVGFQAWERYALPMVAVGALIFVGGVSPRRGTTLLCPYNHQIQWRWVELVTLAVLVLVAPLLVERARLEPHDGGWQGVAEIGAAIEALPAEATVFYTDMGRPLAWYAADARATLVWGGADGEAVMLTLAEYEECPCYLAARVNQPLPTSLRLGRTLQQSGFFRLVELSQ